MTLGVDIGNTNITFGTFIDGELARTFQTSSEPFKMGNPSLPDEIFELTHISEIGIASVVPQVTGHLKELLHRQFPSARITVLKNSDIPIINRYRHPEQAGIDRLLASLSAYRKYESSKRSLIVIDLGTATTIDCITANGEYLGGVIALGVGSSAKALASLTAQLPMIELQFPAHTLGRSTTESIQSGIVVGGLEMLEGLVRRLSSEAFQNESPIVVATGGLTELFKGKSSVIQYFESHLVLKGILITLSSL
jgi:type III pantothenate kinase